jgi:protein phosphatase 1L
MDDDFDDYEVLLSTIGSHIRLLIKSVINFCEVGVNWTTISYLLNWMSLYVMKPTIAFLTLILLFALICHSFDYWIKCLTRSTIKFAKRLNVGLSLVSTALTTLLPNVECITGIANDNVINELKGNFVGVYALQGRRPKMEDKFSYVNDSARLGLEYWAVFDGHGGDVCKHLFIN